MEESRSWGHGISWPKSPFGTLREPEYQPHDMVPPVGGTTLTSPSALLGSTPAPHTDQDPSPHPSNLTANASGSILDGESLETDPHALFSDEALETDPNARFGDKTKKPTSRPCRPSVSSTAVLNNETFESTPNSLLSGKYRNRPPRAIGRRNARITPGKCITN